MSWDMYNGILTRDRLKGHIKKHKQFIEYFEEKNPEILI